MAISITESMINQTEYLASLGLNDKQIGEALGMSYASFRRHKKEHFEQALKKGRLKLRESISNSLIERATEERDTTALIFIAKRMQLLQPSGYEAKEFTSIQEATKELGSVYGALARGDINETMADKLTSMIEKFIKTVEISELEERIQQLEEKLHA